MSVYAENWAGLLELFVSVSGLKLRINIPDTAIIKDGRLLGWFYTNSEGAVARASLHEISGQALHQKIVGHQTADRMTNPFKYIALAHYDSGVSRPLKQQELQQVLSQVSGPYEPPRASDPATELPFCIQSYVIPMRDLRYLATFGGNDGATCTTFARRFSARYTHAMDDPATVRDVIAQATAAASLRTGGQGLGDAGEDRPLTAEELLVESQLVAMGLLEAREPQLQYGEDEEEGPSLADIADAAVPASRKAQQETARAVQTLIAFVERAHGLRVQGIVAEFVQAHPDVFVLLAVHAVQWDSKASRGRLGTFTDRWQDYMAGLGPTPAPRPASKKGNAPGLLRSADASMLIMTERASLASPTSTAHLASAGASPTAARGSPFSPTSAAPAQGDASYLTAARPGSAPAMVLHRFRPQTAGAYGGRSNGNYSVRNALSAARRGAGGNPTASPTTPDSYTLWTPRATLPTESVVGSLALEVEVLKERLQRQADTAARAELALTQLAVSSQATQAALMRQLEDARQEAAAAAEGRGELEAEYERLREERMGLKSELSSAQEELRTARDELAADRATLASTVRSALSKEGDLEGVMGRLKQENELLSGQVAGLQRRLEEEQEITEAARNQLYDYRQMVTMLQGQLRRGKNKPAAVGAGMPPGGIGLPPPSINSLGAVGTGAVSSMNNRQSAVNALSESLELEGGMFSDRLSAGGAAPAASPAPAAPASARRPHSSQRPRTGSQVNSALSSLPVSKESGTKRESNGEQHMTQTVTAEATPGPTSPRAPNTPPVSGPHSSSPPQSLDTARTSLTSLLTRQPSIIDPLRSAMADMRRVRRFGPVEGTAISIVGQQMQGIKEVKIEADKTIVRKDVENPWKPRYDALMLNDLFIGNNGELTERMTETMGHLIKLLQTVEQDLFDIFNYYGVLGRVRYVENKLAMSESQFVKLGRAAGFDNTEPVEDVFRMVGDRLLAYHFDAGGSLQEEFLTFPVFPEALCRLAAQKYEWRPPESVEEADDDIEQPEFIKHVPLANISELPNCNHYGHGPTARIREASPGKSRPASAKSFKSMKSVKSVAPPVPGRPGAGKSRAVSRVNSARSLGGAKLRRASSGSDLEDAVKPAGAVSYLGPQPPDVVLYCIIKTFLTMDLLPNARRSLTAGSIMGKQRANERTAPLDVWL